MVSLFSISGYFPFFPKCIFVHFDRLKPRKPSLRLSRKNICDNKSDQTRKNWIQNKPINMCAKPGDNKKKNYNCNANPFTNLKRNVSSLRLCEFRP